MCTFCASVKVHHRRGIEEQLPDVLAKRSCGPSLAEQTHLKRVPLGGVDSARRSLYDEKEKCHDADDGKLLVGVPAQTRQALKHAVSD
jgi:hypothetical protein